MCIVDGGWRTFCWSHLLPQFTQSAKAWILSAIKEQGAEMVL
jgi:hypothetical protein